MANEDEDLAELRRNALQAALSGDTDTAATYAALGQSIEAIMPKSEDPNE